MSAPPKRAKVPPCAEEYRLGRRRKSQRGLSTHKHFAAAGGRRKAKLTGANKIGS
jgi:hypothetical protein